MVFVSLYCDLKTGYMGGHEHKTSVGDTESKVDPRQQQKYRR